ncbi:MAG: SDR family NAD(P)-dependent oxidoreductase [Anaerolineales bacterium]
MELNNAVVVITGSTRGFGNALARALLARGARVVISGRSQVTVDRVVIELSALGMVIGLACDVSVAEQVYALAEYTLARFGRIDVWVNNAGITPVPGGILDFSPQTAEEVFRVNCLGTLYGTQTAVAVMRRQGFGTIVNLYGRGSDLRPATPSGLYGASKAWITSFTRTMASEYKDLPIRIIGFNPGMMLTDMLTGVNVVVGERTVRIMRSFPMVLRALANPPEVAAAALVRLLERNGKSFVEFRMMSGFRLLKMLSKLIWMQLNPGARPPMQSFPVLSAFEPPLDPDRTLKK